MACLARLLVPAGQLPGAWQQHAPLAAFWLQQQQQQQQLASCWPAQLLQHAAASSLSAELGGGVPLGSQAARDPAERRRSLLDASGKRFYDTVRVRPLAGGGYELLLRVYPIKTPAKQRLVLPSLSLALAVAAEWEWLPNGKPAPHRMPLMGLAATAIDQPKQPARVIEHCLKYVHTDAACIRYEPGALERRQAAAFDPLLRWAQDELGWRLATTHSIFGTTQPAATVAAVEQHLRGLDPWRLAAADQLISTSKSVVVAAALLHGRISVREAVAAARLEEDFQLGDWGMVEAGHDLDIADTHTRIAAPALLVRLLSLP